MLGGVLAREEDEDVDDYRVFGLIPYAVSFVGWSYQRRMRDIFTQRKLVSFDHPMLLFSGILPGLLFHPYVLSHMLA